MWLGKLLSIWKGGNGEYLLSLLPCYFDENLKEYTELDFSIDKVVDKPLICIESSIENDENGYVKYHGYLNKKHPKDLTMSWRLFVILSNDEIRNALRTGYTEMFS
jgi:hypothetical protein